MSWILDVPWVRRGETTVPHATVELISADREAQVGWWRQRLQEQGHALEQIERLIAQYRTAAWRSEPAPSAGSGTLGALDQSASAQQRALADVEYVSARF